ncbi:MAG: 4Fe-4S binding protein [Alphaproteobacteria bacterium]|nr:4Fe-4S binding protein [Alphaproteobacteria bacterium]
MRRGDRSILICDCGGTMTLDGAAIGKACGADGPAEIATALCRRQMSRFVDTLATGGTVVVACTQEAPTFAEVAEDHGADGRVSFINIREAAGWSNEGNQATAKIAALIAAADVPVPPARSLSIQSEGRCLVYGRGQVALDAARRLADTLSVTVMLIDAEDALPPTVAELPVVTGWVAGLTGRLGAFELTVDRFAERSPSVRAGLGFEPPVDGARSETDVIVDLSGEPPLVPAAEKRDGYFRADPRDPAAVLSVVVDAMAMIGEFEKPLYVTVNDTLCAHSRNKLTGCTRCLDLCPAGAITSAGDVVAVDPGLCAGCGLCAGACPTSAITYAYPDAAATLRQITALAGGYRAAGDKAPRLLLHDPRHGAALIEALARYGRGLPADVIPLEVNAVGQIGHDTLLTAFAQGFQAIYLVVDPRKPDDHAGLDHQIAVTDAILSGLGDAGNRVRVLAETDPDALGTALYGTAPDTALPAAPFAPLGRKKAVTRLAVKGLAAALGSTADALPLPKGAPYGRVVIDTEGCTLCLACVGACPASALQDNPDQPQLLFQEDACVQCGLCVATCPEKVITLEPRYGLADSALSAQLVMEDEPFACVSCGKTFGTTRSIQTIKSRLAGKHWMFESDDRSRLIEMCEDCRIEAQFHSKDNPFASKPRPLPRTTEDYQDARERGEELDDE